MVRCCFSPFDVVLCVFPPSFGLDSLTVDGEFRPLAAFENDPEKKGDDVFLLFTSFHLKIQGFSGGELSSS